MNQSSRARIAIGCGFCASYPEGGGHWSWLLQYVLGLRALGHDVLWIEQLVGSDDRRLIDQFFLRVRRHGLEDSCVLLVYPPGSDAHSLQHATIYGRQARHIRQLVRSVDVLWNFAYAIQDPLLSLFRRRALIDVDPGHFQVSALEWDMGIDRHEALATVGGKLHDSDCEVPTLGRQWTPYPPPVHLPFWNPQPTPVSAPFTSVTEWNWGELWLGQRVLSISKRDAYLRYLDLPESTHLPFELAVNLPVADHDGDRQKLLSAGWRVVDPHVVARTPEAYQRYIGRSCAEISCPKPIFRELRTGWFSDRSVAYLASGRPVLAEDTGFTDWLPAGNGVLAFRDIDEALAGADSIQSGYEEHSFAARQLAEDHFDARKVLPALLEATLR